jgi:hypothetical protein
MPVQYAVVGLNVGRKANMPKDIEVWHQTKESAIAEAQRLSGIHPWSRWAVTKMETWFYSPEEEADVEEARAKFAAWAETQDLTSAAASLANTPVAGSPPSAIANAISSSPTP